MKTAYYLYKTMMSQKASSFLVVALDKIDTSLRRSFLYRAKGGGNVAKKGHMRDA